MKEFDSEKSNQYLRTFVKSGDKWFFVSTINRLCSSDYSTVFSETMAWEWDEKEQKRGKGVLEQSGYEDSCSEHLKIIAKLMDEDFSIQ